MENKPIVNLDIQSLYTNIPVKKYILQLKIHLGKKLKKKLSCISVSKLIKIIELCINQRFFKYNNTYYIQKFGFPMGSPLSGII